MSDSSDLLIVGGVAIAGYFLLRGGGPALGTRINNGSPALGVPADMSNQPPLAGIGGRSGTPSVNDPSRTLVVSGGGAEKRAKDDATNKAIGSAGLGTIGGLALGPAGSLGGSLLGQLLPAGSGNTAPADVVSQAISDTLSHVDIKALHRGKLVDKSGKPFDEKQTSAVNNILKKRTKIIVPPPNR